MNIQFISFPGCPHVAAARRVLDRVLAVAGVTDWVEEVDTTAPWTPEHLRNWGSPTILIDGHDFEGHAIPTGPSCRLYTDGLGRRLAAPADMLLLAAVQRAQRGRAPRGVVTHETGATGLVPAFPHGGAL